MLGISCLWGSSWSGYTVHVYGVTVLFSSCDTLGADKSQISWMCSGWGRVQSVLGWCCSTSIKNKHPKNNNKNPTPWRCTQGGYLWLANWRAELTRLDLNWQWEAQVFCYCPGHGSWNTHQWRPEVLWRAFWDSGPVVELCFSELCRPWACQKSKEESGKWTPSQWPKCLLSSSILLEQRISFAAAAATHNWCHFWNSGSQLRAACKGDLTGFYLLPASKLQNCLSHL